MFQSTFPHGERLPAHSRDRSGAGFNPRSRTGNDWRMWPSRSCFQKFQSTFPHGERLAYVAQPVLFSEVSIHVPARGTTYTPGVYANLNWWFQSTFPHGERLSFIIVAIPKYRFQSTFPHGERLQRVRMIGLMHQFQSTFPHGERRDSLKLLPFSVKRFNPRSRTGNDNCLFYQYDNTF